MRHFCQPLRTQIALQVVKGQLVLWRTGWMTSSLLPLLFSFFCTRNRVSTLFSLFSFSHSHTLSHLSLSLTHTARCLFFLDLLAPLISFLRGFHTIFWLVDTIITHHDKHKTRLVYADMGQLWRTGWMHNRALPFFLTRRSVY